MARREERAYREYVSDEQRSQAGCLGVQSGTLICGRVLTSRYDDEATAAWQPVHAKMFVERENALQSIAFSDTNQGGIGDVHRQVAILAHELLHSAHVVATDRKQIDGTVLDHVAQRFLTAPRRTEQMHRLRESRPYGKQWMADRAKRLQRALVRGIADVEDRDQRACVNENAGHGACGGGERGTSCVSL